MVGIHFSKNLQTLKKYVRKGKKPKQEKRKKERNNQHDLNWQPRAGKVEVLLRLIKKADWLQLDTPFKKIAIILKWFEIQDVVKKILKVTCETFHTSK